MNGGSDDGPDQWSRSAESTPSPKDTGPETLIIGHDLPARRGRRRLNQPPPRKGNAASGPVRPLRVFLSAVAGAVLVLAALIGIAVERGMSGGAAPIAMRRRPTSSTCAN